MIDHISIRVSNLKESVKFYEAALSAIGYKQLEGDFDGAIGYAINDSEDNSGHIWLVQSDPNNHNEIVTKNVHVAFSVKDIETVKKFYEAGLKAGGRDYGPPGKCPEYGDRYYGGFLLDPDGNNIEATTYI